MRKSLMTFIVTGLILLVCSIPCMAGERTVAGINTFSPGLFSLEWENEQNRSLWLGTILNGNFTDFNGQVFIGQRYYKNDNRERPYFGYYGDFLLSSYSPGSYKYHIGLLGVIGYEWRFGEEKNTRLFLESHMRLGYADNGDISIAPMAAVGFGFNI